jgi:hypothetical protein
VRAQSAPGWWFVEGSRRRLGSVVRFLCLRSGRSRIVPLGDRAESAPWAEVMAQNPLDTTEVRVPEGSAPRLVGWSGTLAEAIFGEDPRTWGPRGWGELDAFCGRIAPVLASRGLTLCFRPHARHVLSDVPSCLRFLRGRAEHAGGGGRLFGLLLDPVSMLTGSMVSSAEDHVARILDALGGAEGVCGLLVANVRVVGAEEAGGLAEAAPVHEGLIPVGRLGALVRDGVPAWMPVVFSEALGDPAEQAAALAPLLARS